MTTPDVTELQRISDWIAMRSAPGMPCDNCSLPLAAGEKSEVARVETDRGILLFVVCATCSLDAGSNVDSRLVSQDTIDFLKSHANANAGVR